MMGSSCRERRENNDEMDSNLPGRYGYRVEIWQVPWHSTVLYGTKERSRTVKNDIASCIKQMRRPESTSTADMIRPTQIPRPLLWSGSPWGCVPDHLHALPDPPRSFFYQYSSSFSLSLCWPISSLGSALPKGAVLVSTPFLISAPDPPNPRSAHTPGPGTKVRGRTHVSPPSLPQKTIPGTTV